MNLKGALTCPLTTIHTHILYICSDIYTPTYTKQYRFRFASDIQDKTLRSDILEHSRYVVPENSDQGDSTNLVQCYQPLRFVIAYWRAPQLL